MAVFFGASDAFLQRFLSCCSSEVRDDCCQRVDNSTELITPWAPQQVRPTDKQQFDERPRQPIAGGYYTGQWADEQRNGQGTWERDDGTIYEGLWSQDEPSGQGREIMTDGRVFEGSFLRGQRHGYGQQMYGDGRRYQGQWLKGKIHGEGQMFWSDGSRYEGQYIEDQKSGFGKFNWPDGRSYQGHPDPDRFHLKVVSQFIRKFFVFSSGCGDLSMFWDFGSLHQGPDRSSREKELFNKGLAASNIWYASTETTVWLQPHLPIGFAGATYGLSGWCFFEASVSSAIKPSYLRLNLGNVEINDLGNVLTEDIFLEDRSLLKMCMKNRLPPLTPHKFESLLMNEKKFTNGKEDAERVAKLY